MRREERGERREGRGERGEERGEGRGGREERREGGGGRAGGERKKEEGGTTKRLKTIGRERVRWKERERGRER